MIQGQVVWFEIPVTDLERAILFYTKILSIKIEKKNFLDKEHGVFNCDRETTKGVLVIKENYNPGSGIILFFYVVNLSESLAKVEKYGGKVLVEKTLIKQKTSGSYLAISSNLIDGKIGYFSEFLDCEGNRICLYSNS